MENAKRYKLIVMHIISDKRLYFFCQDMNFEVQIKSGLKSSQRFIYNFKYDKNQLQNFNIPYFYDDCEIDNFLKMPKYILKELKIELQKIELSKKFQKNLNNLINLIH